MNKPKPLGPPVKSDFPTPAVEPTKLAPVETKKAVREVRAVGYFTDAQTQRSYNAGDLIVGWDEARVQEYVKRGLVYLTSAVGPTELK